MTEKVKDDLLRLKPDAKCITVPHPLYDHFGAKLEKLEARSKLGIPADKKVLLFFGFIRDYKGLDLLIDAVKLLDDSYILLIAGEVYAPPFITKYIEEGGMRVIENYYLPFLAQVSKGHRL